MTAPARPTIRFVITITDGKREWDMTVVDQKIHKTTWNDLYAAMDADPKCPFKRGQTIWVKSNWQKRDI